MNSHRNDLLKKVIPELEDLKLPSKLVDLYLIKLVSEEEINNKFNDLRKYSNDLFEASLKPYLNSQAYQNSYQSIQVRRI